MLVGQCIELLQAPRPAPEGRLDVDGHEVGRGSWLEAWCGPLEAAARSGCGLRDSEEGRGECIVPVASNPSGPAISLRPLPAGSPEESPTRLFAVWMASCKISRSLCYPYSQVSKRYSTVFEQLWKRPYRADFEYGTALTVLKTARV